jgi:4-hydroxy 2-oxovalerate aldolase
VDKPILISDPTLRDGNHAISHQLTSDDIVAYATAADAAGIPIIEVGHGCGIGASSLQIGLSRINDDEMLGVARKSIRNARLAVHSIPGIATIRKDIMRAIEIGVDIVRVASHCSEADTCQQHIRFVRDSGRTAHGVLMMSHMIAAETLCQEAKKLQDYGAERVIIMDSAGSYLPNDVTDRISALIKTLSIPVGFHAHNNLGMAVANSVAAVAAGATLIDATARGIGAGAGNTQLEVVAPVLTRMGYQTGIELYKLFDASDIAERRFAEAIPCVKPLGVVSGLAGVVSAFAKQVERISEAYGVDGRDVLFELGRRRVVAGQEDVIVQVAVQLAAEKARPVPQYLPNDCRKCS